MAALEGIGRAASLRVLTRAPGKGQEAAEGPPGVRRGSAWPSPALRVPVRCGAPARGPGGVALPFVSFRLLGGSFPPPSPLTTENICPARRVSNRRASSESDSGGAGTWEEAGCGSAEAVRSSGPLSFFRGRRPAFLGYN